MIVSFNRITRDNRTYCPEIQENSSPPDIVFELKRRESLNTNYPDLKNLALFLRVATLGAIGRAGEEFDLSTTNASQRIQALEAELGVKLFHRTTRAVTLTPDGQVLVGHAKRILDDVEEARNVFSDHAGAVQGTLRVTAPTSFGHSHITPYIPELLQRYPDLQLELDWCDTLTDIVKQGYDVAFRIGELETSSLLARRIDDNPMRIVASPDYLEREGQPQTPQELVTHNCLPFDRFRVWHFKTPDNKITQVEVSGRITLNSGDAISELVEAGIGIGMASLWHAGPSIQAGRVIPILSEYPIWPETKIWAVRPPGNLMPIRVKAFLDFMQKRIRAVNKERYGDLV
jgi:DNA-binding transcriptional LysR family regulator